MQTIKLKRSDVYSTKDSSSSENTIKLKRSEVYEDEEYVKKKREKASDKLTSFTDRYSALMKDAEKYLRRTEADPFETSITADTKKEKTLADEASISAISKRKASAYSPDTAGKVTGKAKSAREWADSISKADTLKSDTDNIKKEAEKLLEELESDKAYISDDEYRFYKDLLSSVSSGDYTELGNALSKEAEFRKNYDSREDYLSEKKAYEKQAENDRKFSAKYGFDDNTSVDEIAALAEEALDRNASIKRNGLTVSPMPEEEIEWLEAQVAKRISLADVDEWKKAGGLDDIIGKYSYSAALNSVGKDGDSKQKEKILERDKLQSLLDEYSKVSLGPVAEQGDYMRSFVSNYGNPQDIRAQIDTLNAEIDNYELYSFLANVPNSEGFRKYAKDSTAVANTKNRLEAEGKNGHSMTDSEAAIYNYLRATDKNKAEQFFTLLSSDLEERSKNEKLQGWADFAEKLPILSSGASVLTSLGGGVEYLAETLAPSLLKYPIESLQGKAGLTEAKAPDTYLTDVTNTIRGKVSEEASYKIGNWDAGAFLYNTTMSGLDSVTAAMTMGNLGGIALGVSAAAQGTQNALERGLTNDQAFWAGIASGTFEMLFETVSIGQFKALQEVPAETVKEFAKNIAKTMVVNASEEMLTEVANITYDIIAHNELSDYAARVQELLDNNPQWTDEEAKQKAAVELALQVLESGASGALMGFGMAGAADASSSVKNIEAKTAEGHDILSQYGSSEALANDIMKMLNIDRSTYSQLFEREGSLLNAKAKKNGDYSNGTARFAQKTMDKAVTELSKVTKQKKTDIIKSMLRDKGVDATKASELGEEILNALGNSNELNVLKKKYEGDSTATTAIDELTNPENENYDSSLLDSIEAEDNAILSLALGRAHFDTDYTAEGGRIDEAKTELGEVVRFEEITDEDGGTVLVPVIEVDGKEVSASDIDLKAGSIYSSIEGMDVGAANEMISAYKKHGEGLKASDFAAEWRLAYQMGLANRNSDSADFKGHRFNISPEAAEAARALGQGEYRGERAARETGIKKAQKKKTGREGRISTDKVQNKKLITDGAMTAARVLSIAGYNIEFFEDVSDSADRGSYQWSTNTIRLNVAVGTGRGGIDYILGRTLSHELVHSIQRWNAKGYEELKGFIIEKMGDSFEGMVSRKMKRLGLEYAEAVDEVIADGCEMMLRNSKSLTEFAKEHRRLFEKICDVVQEFINKIRGAISSLYGESTALHDEARFMELYADELQKVFDKALSDALNASEATVDHNLQSNANKKAAEDGGKVQYSFSGVKSNLADNNELATAKTMLKNGYDTETIRQETGWFKGYDGKWRYEIDDSKMFISRMTLNEVGNITKYGYLVEHDDLFDAYPHLQNLVIEFKDIPAGQGQGYFVHNGNKIVIDKSIRNNIDELKSILIHETQHAIQEFEGFTPGADGKDFAKYLRTAGEIEAYDTADRLNYSAEQRKNNRPDIDRTDVVFAEDSKTSAEIITLDDVRTLRSIIEAHNGQRVSINDFTSEDIQKAQKWAYKFYKELGVKSPFFRAWFGDWRAHSIDPAELVSFAYGETPKINYNKRTVKNADMNKRIIVDDDVVRDSLSYASKHGDKKQTEKILGKVDEILQKGFLLDTKITSDQKGNKKGSTQFMHYLYTPVSINGAPFLAKLTVEEYDVDGKTRAYNLRRIEMPELSRTQFSSLIAGNRGKFAYNSDALSVAQLFDFVKQYDKEFKPKPVHELLTDKGRPRKLYHGTNSEFFEFDLKKSGANYGNTSEGLLFFTSKKGAYPDSATDYAREITKKKGGKETVREVYVSMQKPLVLDSRGYYTTQSYFDENHEEIYNRYLSGDYDGIIIHNSDKSADDAVLAIIDNAGQVKSATYSEDLSGETDNIGTFDRGQKDIRYSRGESYGAVRENAATAKKDSEGHKLSEGQMEYFEKSVIRDKRGRLIPVYHGTKNAGFTIFSKSDDIGYFFARSLRTAETYSGSKQIFAPDRNSPEFEGAANYKVYLNITNPLIIEGKGAYWNNLESIGERVTLDVNIRSTADDGSCNVTIKMDREGKAEKKTFRTTDEVYDFFESTFDGNIARAMGLYMDGTTAETGKGKFSCQFAWDFERGKKGYSKNTRELVRRAYNSTAGYDGVIFKDVIDGSEGKLVPADDLYVAFNSEQIKSVKNTEPSRDSDIRYSRGEEYDPYEPYTPPAYATMPEYSAPLEGKYDYQGEGYTAANGLKLFSKYSVDTARDYIMSELMLTDGKVDLARDLNEFYTFMATARKLTWDDIEQRAGAIADRYLSRRSEKITRDPRAQEALDTIRSTRITFDEKQKADAKAFSGSFGKYRQSLMGRVSITTDGIPLDSQWQEWAELFTEYFSADTNSNDMPRVLYETIEKMKNARADDGFSLTEEEEHNRAVQLIYDSFRKVTQEAVSQEAVLHGKKKVYGDSLIDALERTVQTQVDMDIINRYRNTEADVQRKRRELAAVYKEMNSALFTPMDEQEAYKLQKLTNDRKALNKEIKALERDIKKARDDVTVSEGVIRDPNSTESARNGALVRVVQERQALSRLERTLSAKKSALAELETDIQDARNPRVNALKELKEKATALRAEISAADRELLEMRSTKIFKTLLARERALAIKETKELMGRRQRESAKRQENTALRQRIWKELQRLDSMLALPSVAKHIPDTMRSTVALLSKAVPGRDVDYDAKIAKMTEIMRASTGQAQIDAEQKIAEYNAKKEYAQRVTTALSDVFTSFDEDSPVFDEAVYKEIEALKKEIAGKSLDELDNSELKRLNDVICATKAAIKNADKVFGERRGLANLGMEGTEEVLSASDDTARGPARQKLHDFLEKQKFSMLKPYELFEITGSTVLYERFRKLQAREGVYYRNVNEASEYYKRVAKEHGITDRMLREKFSFTTSEGREIALSINEIMSIYLMKDRAQAMVHLTNPSGGFRFAGGYTVETKKAKAAKTADEKMQAVKYVYKKTSDPVHLTDVDVISIGNMLTKEQKAFANAIQRYMADVLGEKGNEVSMALHDFKKYNDPNYFPIHTDESYRLLSIEKAAGEIQLKNLGFTKDLKYKASGPLVLENMTDVFARHANEMSLYNAFAVELENMKRVLNFSDPITEEGGSGKGMKAALGQALTNEIVDFIKSVNGGLRSESMGVADTMIALNKAARVGASLSVAIQQPSAILRSFAMIDPKYFAGIPGKGSWEEMKKYTATAGIKELGGVDVNTSRAITDQLTELEAKGRTAGANVSKAIAKAAFILPEVGDRKAWISLWNACKREAAQSYHGEAILVEAGKRFDEIVNRTQVYDSVFSRSKLMRSKNTFAKMVTAFMAEPMTTANMVLQAARDFKTGNKAKGIRAIAAVATSILINNALVAFIYAMRDDDEDESYIEKYIEAFLQKMGTDVNPVTYIPVFKDVLSLVQGYDVERMDMSLVSDVIDEAQALVNLWMKEDATTEEWMNAWLSFGGRILDFAGVPISNFSRDANAVFVKLPETLKTKSTKQGLREALRDGLFEDTLFEKFWKPSDTDANKLYRAMKSRDSVRYNQIAKRLESEGKTLEEIKSLIRSGLKANDERITTAAKLTLEGKTKEYEKLVKEISKDGFAETYVSGAIESVVSEMKEEPPTEDEFGVPNPMENEEFTSIYSADHIFYNLEAGDVKEAQIAIEDIYDKKYQKALSKLKENEDEKDAESSALSSLRSMISEDYRPIYKSGDDAERERIEELLLSIYVNGEQLYKEKTIKGWGEDD